MSRDGYTEAKPLLVIFHDPAETIGETNAHTGAFDPHNVIVTDVSKQYLEFAIEQKFSVIDVNMPKFVSQTEVSESHHGAEHELTRGQSDDNFEDIDPLESRLKAMRDCAIYLWENHIEPYDATHIFLMGVGDSAISVTSLLSTADEIQHRISWVFNFISEHDLRAVQRAGDDYVADWYYKHSDCFVAQDHQAWSPERSRRVRRKYGNLRRSGFNDLSEMLVEAKNEVTQRMLEETKTWREEEKRRVAAPPTTQRIPAMRTGLGFGDELKMPPSQSNSPFLGYGGAPQFGHPADMPVRSSPAASPRRDVLKSPVNKLPPMGRSCIFGVSYLLKEVVC